MQIALLGFCLFWLCGGFCCCFCFVLGFFICVKLEGVLIVWILFWQLFSLAVLLFCFVFLCPPTLKYLPVCRYSRKLSTAHTNCIFSSFLRLQQINGGPGQRYCV